ncbi:MAG: hypothetical protein C5B48_02740 [Candidatus Rokuibacteriota bacterium]|nr:MAG: hypothetical protein C5B48_02740 [Candidatus Rokubacteria bacterium]
MRIAVALALVLLFSPQVSAVDPLTSPYQRQAETNLRGLSESEVADLKAGRGMGLARAAELNNYPGPRHVLDAVAAGRLAASADQIQRVQQIFDEMNSQALSVGAQILDEEQLLEAGFRAATVTEPDLRSRVLRIATLQGDLRAIHLTAHLATRAVLSESQVARYNELRGYTARPADQQGHEHKH